MAEAPVCHQDAARRLHRNRIGFARIIRVDPDAILYLSSAGQPMTGWLRSSDGIERIFTEPSFPAEPDANLVPRLTGEGWEKTG